MSDSRDPDKNTSQGWRQGSRGLPRAPSERGRSVFADRLDFALRVLLALLVGAVAVTMACGR
jgi:hypothetical protein